MRRHGVLEVGGQGLARMLFSPPHEAAGCGRTLGVGLDDGGSDHGLELGVKLSVFVGKYLEIGSR
jgi:hypothetical protein